MLDSLNKSTPKANASPTFLLVYPLQHSNIFGCSKSKLDFLKKIKTLDSLEYVDNFERIQNWFQNVSLIMFN